MIRRTFLVLLVIGLGACGDSTGPQGANLTGTWNATLTVTGGNQATPGTQFTAVFTLTQDGTSVSGTFLVLGGLTGQVSGNVSGQSVTFAISQPAPCLGTFNGSASVTLSDTRLNGSYSGSDCDGTLQADLSATKQ